MLASFRVDDGELFAGKVQEEFVPWMMFQVERGRLADQPLFKPFAELGVAIAVGILPPILAPENPSIDAGTLQFPFKVGEQFFQRALAFGRGFVSLIQQRLQCFLAHLQQFSRIVTSDIDQPQIPFNGIAGDIQGLTDGLQANAIAVLQQDLFEFAHHNRFSSHVMQF